MNRNKFEIEVCAATIQSVIAAEKGGANRVELCDNITEGGTTPSIGTLIQAKEKTNIEVFVMIRPRGGDFLYNDDEIAIMEKDILMAKKYGADGFVFGCLNPNGTINKIQCARLIEKAGELPVTYHRAFDLCANPFESIEVIKQLGFKRILTSGQQNKAIDGIERIASLIEKSGKEIKIMAGSGINENNILKIAQRTRASSFHVSLRQTIDSKMTYRKNGISMGSFPAFDEYAMQYSSAERIQNLINQLLNI